VKEKSKNSQIQVKNNEATLSSIKAWKR